MYVSFVVFLGLEVDSITVFKEAKKLKTPKNFLTKIRMHDFK